MRNFSTFIRLNYIVLQKDNKAELTCFSLCQVFAQGDRREFWLAGEKRVREKCKIVVTKWGMFKFDEKASDFNPVSKLHCAIIWMDGWFSPISFPGYQGMSKQLPWKGNTFGGLYPAVVRAGIFGTWPEIHTCRLSVKDSVGTLINIRRRDPHSPSSMEDGALDANKCL